jgi:DNA-binding winged helix-turn-helix (wHTH) protein/Tol biopolymer transport system component
VPRQIIRFSAFEFDFQRKELRNAGFRVRLSASQVRLLTLFLERAGELVTRDEIVARIWTDTNTIDVTRGINTAINRLRTTLGDDPTKPVFLETIIGLGYRFIATIEEVPGPALAPAIEPPEPAVTSGEPSSATEEHDGTASSAAGEPKAIPTGAHAPEASRSLRAYRLTFIVSVCLVLAILLAISLHRRRPAPQQAALTLPPIRFSPVTLDRAENKVTAEAVSPDGEALAFADHSGLSLYWFKQKTEMPLGAIPASAVTHIAWFPDGRTLLVSTLNVDTNRKLVRLVPVTGDYSRVLATDSDLATVSPDGSRIAFARRQDTEIWTASPDGQNLHHLMTAKDKSAFSFLLWSLDSKRLVLASHIVETVSNPALTATGTTPIIPEDARDGDVEHPEHWVCDSVDAASGNLLDHEDNIRIDSAFLLPDGRMEYVTGEPFANAQIEISTLSVRTDPDTGHFLSKPYVENRLSASNAEGLSASRDGARVAVIMNRIKPDIFTASLQSDAPGALPAIKDIQRLTYDVYDSYPHAWTPDGAVLYETYSHGKAAIFKQTITETTPHLLAELPHAAAMPQLSPDGKWVLFMEFATPAHPNAIYRVPVTGGQPERVPISGPIEEFHCPSAPNTPCVLREALDHDAFVYYALDPVKGMGKLLTRTAWEPSLLGDWSVSPDGSTVAAAGHDARHPSIHLIQLDSASADAKSLPVNGYGTTQGVHWTHDGHALFVETRGEDGYNLIYLDLSGHEKALYKSPLLIWAVPSLDGKKIAFPVYTTNTNVWAASINP